MFTHTAKNEKTKDSTLSFDSTLWRQADDTSLKLSLGKT